MCSDNKQVTIGGIIKHKAGGYGFKLTFQTPETANKYKDMIRWIIKDDSYQLTYKTGYHDTYKEDGMK